MSRTFLHCLWILPGLALGTSACRAAGPDGLWSSLPAGPPAETASGLATPGQGIPIPKTCTVDSSSVTHMTQVEVPAGEFAMGCNAKVDSECNPDEKPQHMVQLDAFAIDITEVTQAQYALCIQAGKCSAPYCAWDPCANPNLPIACVYRQQAIDYCTYVSEKLPTEAQWEKAARGTDGRLYPWGNDPLTCQLANVIGCGKGTRDVGTLPDGASPYGALDMAGNVAEWTLDVYDATYYTPALATDPTGPAPTASSVYVGRGGGWQSEDTWERTSVRDQYEALYVKNTMGFRCMTNVTPTPAAAPTE